MQTLCFTSPQPQKQAFPPILIVDLSGEISDPFTERFYFTEHFITRKEDYRDFQTIRPIAFD